MKEIFNKIVNFHKKICIIYIYIYIYIYVCMYKLNLVSTWKAILKKIRIDMNELNENLDLIEYKILTCGTNTDTWH